MSSSTRPSSTDAGDVRTSTAAPVEDPDLDTVAGSDLAEELNPGATCPSIVLDRVDRAQSCCGDCMQGIKGEQLAEVVGVGAT